MNLLFIADLPEVQRRTCRDATPEGDKTAIEKFGTFKIYDWQLQNTFGVRNPVACRRVNSAANIG
jgi:hypothetical protein